MLAYVFFKPVDIDWMFTEAIQSELPEELSKFSAPLEKAFEEIRFWTTTAGMGSVLSSFGNQMAICIPMDKVPLLSEFLKKYEYTAKTKFAVGVGNTTREAYQALCVSEAGDGDRVVLFSEDLDGQGNQDDYLSKSEDLYKIDIPGLNLDQELAPDSKDKDAPGVAKENKNTKQKVIETLLLLKQHSHDISQLKQINPQAFAAVKKIIDVMISLASSGQIK